VRDSETEIPGQRVPTQSHPRRRCMRAISDGEIGNIGRTAVSKPIYDPRTGIHPAGGSEGFMGFWIVAYPTRWALFVLFITLAPTTGSAEMLPLFGPMQFAQKADRPQRFRRMFENCESLARYKLVVINGNPNGTHQASRAAVVLNGVRIMGPRDLNQRVARVERRINVLPSNRLRVRISSNLDVDNNDGDDDDNDATDDDEERWRSAGNRPRPTRSSLTVSVECISGCLGVQITFPTSNATIDSGSTRVAGTVSTTADEVGVRVNDRTGLVHVSQFVATDVPITVGSNSLMATATNSCGNQAVQKIAGPGMP
jgi:hypothetical protein